MSKLKITVDPKSGFCFGVVYAIEMAENILKENNKLYCLGDIVHNNREVDRLNNLGLEIIDHKRLSELNDCKVLIRAHGEPPSTYEIALKNNIELLDASCPVVLKLQHQIKEGYETIKKIDGQIIIYGKQGHAEVTGLVGQTNGEAIIVTTKEDISKIDFEKPIYMTDMTKSIIYLMLNDYITIMEDNREKALNEFKKITGCPVLVNTSFNVRGEPIVCSILDAFNCFMGTNLDILVIENFILFKNEQDKSLLKDYKNKFELD